MENSKCVGFRTVQNDLTPISYKWRQLGLQLNLDDDDLENITGEGNRCYRCLSSTLQHWVKNDRDATKTKLVETLKSSAIGERRLAGKVEQYALPADRHLTAKDLKILMELLSGVSHNWYMLGIQLDIDTGVLSRFEEFNRDVAQYMKQMLKLLMKVDPPITVGQLLEALRSPIVGENALAGKLEKSYGTKGWLFESGDDSDTES
ncbi:hypothetical protein EMCRGX_G013319 [Ephydatia muelleri]|eukprot:Em0004g983a